MTKDLLTTLKSGLMVAQRDGHQILQLPDPHLVAVLEALDERVRKLEERADSPCWRLPSTPPPNPGSYVVWRQNEHKSHLDLAAWSGEFWIDREWDAPVTHWLDVEPPEGVRAYEGGE